MAAAVAHLHGRNGTLTGDHLSQLAECRLGLGVIKLDMITYGKSLYAVNDSVANADRGCSAHSLALIIAHGAVKGSMLSRGVLSAGGGSKNSVSEKGIAYLERTEQVGIFAFVHGNSSNYCF